MINHMSKAAKTVIATATYYAKQNKCELLCPEHIFFALQKHVSSFYEQNQDLYNTFEDTFYFDASTVMEAESSVHSPHATELLFLHAYVEKEILKLKEIEPICLFLALFRSSNLVSDFFSKHKINYKTVEPLGQTYQLSSTIVENIDNAKKIKRLPENLTQFGRDLTYLARMGQLDPVIGREKEIERVAQVLSRRKKNNPVLIGEPGVGKTAIAEGLANLIVEQKVNPELLDREIFELDMTSVTAGTSYRGQFEERMKNITQEIEKRKNVIVFIDELHTVLSAGSSEYGLHAGNILKPALARGTMTIIGATTIEEFKKTIEKDAAFERRLQKILVEEPTVEQTIEIIKGLRSYYESHHKVFIDNKLIKPIVQLAEQYLPERKFPDKAIDVVDEVCAYTHLKTVRTTNDAVRAIDVKIDDTIKQKIAAVKKNLLTEAKLLQTEITNLREAKQILIDEMIEEDSLHWVEITLDDVKEVVSKLAKVPINSITQEIKSKIISLEKNLLKKIIGQNAAVSQITETITRNSLGLNDPHRPIGSFIFLGPTGVGKTELAKVLASELFAHKDSFIRLDMSEYADKIAVTKLTGSAPGYVGYEEGSLLIDKVRKNPHSLILFDEIEKAHKDIYNVLLQILDEGTLTDNLGRTANFKNCVIIFTSNLGTAELNKNTLGFTANRDIDVAKKALEKHFAPEFLNRIDSSIYFNFLTKEDAKKITEIEVLKLLQRAEENTINPLKLVKDQQTIDKLVNFLAEKGFDEKFGARQIKRTIQTTLELEIAKRALSSKKINLKEVLNDITKDSAARNSAQLVQTV